MLVLGVHSGWADAGAAVFDDYAMLAAVPLARLTGMPRDGGRLPIEAIVECLDIAGLRADEIGALCLSQGVFPGRYYNHLSLPRRLGRGLRQLFGRDTPISLSDEMRRHGQAASALLNLPVLLDDLGLNRNIAVHVYRDHAAQSLLALAEAEWDHGLVYTADETGCCASVLKYGRLAVLFDDETDLAAETLTPGRLLGLCVDALGLPDAVSLFALAAHGEPMLGQAMLAHLRVDDDGHIQADFSAEGGVQRWLRRLAQDQPPALVASSLHFALSSLFAQAIAALMQRHDLRHLALGGSLFADPRMVHMIGQALQPAGLSLYPRATNAALPLGGVLDLLLQRDGIADWQHRRQPLAQAAWGRDYTADIDPVLGNAGCRLVSHDPVRAAAALLNAGKLVACYDGRARGADGGAARLVLFSGGNPGATASANQRLERPGWLPPAIYVARVGLGLLCPGLDIAQAQGGIAALPAPRWQQSLHAALLPDGLVVPVAVDAQQSPLLADLLAAYASLSELPALLGLPMQVGNLPPADAPAEALQLLQDGRVDYIVTDNAVWERGT